MVSTFGGLSTAYSGLNAARQGLDVVGQNITNASTTGYTRQRISTSAVGTLAQVGPLAGGSPLVGQGVMINGITRIGDAFLDARVRATAATSGNLAVQSNALTNVQATLNEPGANGLSAQLQQFWSAWGDVQNAPGNAAPAGVLIQKANQIVGQIAAGYKGVDAEWSSNRSKLGAMVDELNSSGQQVAALNAQIRTTLQAGGSANELIDQRDALTTSIAALTGGAVRQLDDGTAEVLVGGNALVSGDSFHALAVTGSTAMAGAATNPVGLQWVDRPTLPVSVESGEIAGELAILAPANGSGTGGAIAEAAAGYSAFATYLANAVNTLHTAGSTPTGATGLAFFGVSATGPAALGLSVIPTGPNDIATGTPGAGALDGSNADKIAALGSGAGSPDSVWASFVTRIGTLTKSVTAQATLADTAAKTASNAQLSGASVDMDEENVNMMTFQTAYQGAARVLTSIDEMLDTLINHTGIVGR